MKPAIKLTLVILTLLILSLPFFYPDNPWALAAIVLILVLDTVIGLSIPNQDRNRSRH